MLFGFVGSISKLNWRFKATDWESNNHQATFGKPVSMRAEPEKSVKSIRALPGGRSKLAGRNILAAYFSGLEGGRMFAPQAQMSPENWDDDDWGSWRSLECRYIIGSVPSSPESCLAKIGEGANIWHCGYSDRRNSVDFSAWIWMSRRSLLTSLKASRADHNQR